MSDDEPVDVVASAGPLDATIVLLREFLHRSGAIRAVAVVDRAPGEGPAIVDCARLAPTEVTADERTVVLPHAIELEADPPAGLDEIDVRPLPPFEVRREEGEIAAPLGGLEHHARAVRGLAAVLGGRHVAMATFETSDPEAPLSISARVGDPLVLSLGEDEYEMDPGWP
jgi:hypothetical protein